MLRPYVPPAFSGRDVAVFDAVVRRDHWVRRAMERVDFLPLRESLEEFYSNDVGCPAVEPVILLKLELLMYHDNLSDSQVMLRAETDMSYRLFLGLGLKEHLPDVSTLRYFRNRLGAEGHKGIFHALLKQAREHGLVKDRLRIKDASHVYANIALPAGLELTAQARNRLLDAAEAFEPDSVAGERIRIETIRASTENRGNDERLHARVGHLRDILTWVQMLPAPADADTNPSWRKLSEAIRIARKVLDGQDEPEAGDKLRSVSDPDARRGRHGEFYDGFLVDVTVDPDSQLFTAINVLQANGGDESSDAVELVQQEMSYHGNKIEQLSIDGAGYDGPVLRTLEKDLSIKVFVPAKANAQPDRLAPEEFSLSEDGTHVTCPAGQKSRYSQRDNSRHTTTYRFTKETCAACPLSHKCLSRAETLLGRSVRKNDYAAEYDRVRNRAKTPEYIAIKKEHPLVERKLGLLMNRYGGRRARYRGRFRVLCQQVIAVTTANLDRILRLLDTDAQAVFG
jgi:transposase